MIDSWTLDAALVASGHNAVSFALCLILTPPVKVCEDASVQPKSEPTLILTHKGTNTPPSPTLCHTHSGTNMKLSNAGPSATDGCIIICIFCGHVKANNLFPVLFPVGSALILQGQLYIQRICHVAAECGGARVNTTHLHLDSVRLSAGGSTDGRTDVWFTAV